VQAASKQGQAFSPQSVPSGPGAGERASTCGDKLEKTTKHAADWVHVYAWGGHFSLMQITNRMLANKLLISFVDF